MRRRILSVLLAFGLSTPLISQGAFAQGRGRGAGHAPVFAGDQHRGDSWGRDRDEDRFDRDFDHGRRGRSSIFATSDRPPGWSHGKKSGWGNCDMPPGQAKKHGCRVTRPMIEKHEKK